MHALGYSVDLKPDGMVDGLPGIAFVAIGAYVFELSF